MSIKVDRMRVISVLFIVIILIIVLYYFKEIRDEGFFGTSPGTLVQLASTHVPKLTYDPQNELSFTRFSDKEDQEVEDKIQSNLIKKGLIDMTESGYYSNNFASV